MLHVGILFIALKFAEYVLNYIVFEVHNRAQCVMWADLNLVIFI